MSSDSTARQLVAGVWLIRGARVLMLERADGVWAPAGGFVEDGESPLQGAIRETLEETGFSLPPELELLHDFVWERETPYHIYQYVAAAPEGDVRISHEHIGSHWFEPDEYVARQLSPPSGTTLPAHVQQWLAEMRVVAERAKAWIAAREQ